MSLAGPFMFDPRRFFGDEEVKLLTWEEVGVYLALLSHQWEEGTVPADPRRAAAAVASGLRGCPDVELAERLLHTFFDDVEGEPRKRNAVLEEDRAAWIAKNEKRADAARRSHARRKAKSEQAESATGANPEQMQSKCTAESNPGSGSGSGSGSTPPRKPPQGGADTVPKWATNAAKGTEFDGREVWQEVCACVEAVHGKAPDPARVGTSADSILRLWRKLGQPSDFFDDFRLVALAAHKSPQPIFARDIRAEGWAGGTDRQFSVPTIAVQKHWAERLEYAQVWRSRSRAVDFHAPGPDPRPPPESGTVELETGVLEADWALRLEDLATALAVTDPEDDGYRLILQASELAKTVRSGKVVLTFENEMQSHLASAALALVVDLPEADP